MKTKKSSKKQARRPHKLHTPRTALKIRTEAKKGGVTPSVVNGLVKRASAAKDPRTATPLMHTARLLARGKFRRAFKLAAKNPALASVRPAIVRGLKALNPRFYQKHAAA